jgi:hypothetical protein
MFGIANVVSRLNTARMREFGTRPCEQCEPYIKILRLDFEINVCARSEDTKLVAGRPKKS